MIEYDIWFSMIGMSYKHKLDILKQYKDLKQFYEICKDNMLKDKPLQNKVLSVWNESSIDSIISTIYNNDIKVISYFDSVYPKRLKQYEDAPSILYYKGDIEKLNNNYNISIVGSRKCTYYGINVTKVISAELSKNKINIISGMAKGIDTIAHRTCIENNGYTCAVLGSGLDRIYPVENKSLFNNIISSGCVISEFPPGTPPLALNFPIRNRIISELSDIVIIVEAGLKSGSLITARLALDLGIDVMSVPGSIFSEQSKGSNRLIKDGAFPLISFEDIYDLLNLSYCGNVREKHDELNDIERKIYKVLSDSPIHLDDIIKTTNVDIKHLYEVLFELQLKDEILCLAGNYYVKNNKVI
jgi:DNA processing protein